MIFVQTIPNLPDSLVPNYSISSNFTRIPAQEYFLKHSKSKFAIGLKITTRYLIVIARNIGVPSRSM